PPRRGRRVPAPGKHLPFARGARVAADHGCPAGTVIPAPGARRTGHRTDGAPAFRPDTHGRRPASLAHGPGRTGAPARALVRARPAGHARTPGRMPRLPPADVGGWRAAPGQPAATGRIAAIGRASPG